MGDCSFWWRQGSIYQIYPLSFQESDGATKGDLLCILSRLDYLESLGVDAVWLGPIDPSPMADFGYDIAAFTDVRSDLWVPSRSRQADGRSARAQYPIDARLRA